MLGIVLGALISGSIFFPAYMKEKSLRMTPLQSKFSKPEEFESEHGKTPPKPKYIDITSGTNMLVNRTAQWIGAPIYLLRPGTGESYCNTNLLIGLRSDGAVIWKDVTGHPWIKGEE